MESVEYVQATAADLAMLIEMRTQFMHELVGKQTEERERALEASLTEYFTREINQQYLCWYAKVNGETAAAAGMCIRVQPGGVSNPSGRWGYIMNVFTKPQYRKRGLSKQLVQLLLDTGKEMGITAFELHATPEGEPLYVDKGFRKHTEPTYRLFF